MKTKTLLIGMGAASLINVTPPLFADDPGAVSDAPHLGSELDIGNPTLQGEDVDGIRGTKELGSMERDVDTDTPRGSLAPPKKGMNDLKQDEAEALQHNRATDSSKSSVDGLDDTIGQDDLPGGSSANQ